MPSLQILLILSERFSEVITLISEGDATRWIYEDVQDEGSI